MYPSSFTPVPAAPAPGSKKGPPVKPKSSLVYLRQDQNIPENFCDKFRPIEPPEPSLASAPRSLHNKAAHTSSDGRVGNGVG